MSLHRPIPLSALAVLAALALCVPAHPLATLPGTPLGIPGGLCLVVGLALLSGVRRQVSHAPGWLLALGFLAVLRGLTPMLSPSPGWEATYWTDSSTARGPERSTESPLAGATRIDRTIDFSGATFPVHFFNDMRRFNYYRPSEPARDTLPFTATWSGVINRVPENARALVVVTNGPAEVSVNAQRLVTAVADGAVRAHAIPLNAFSAPATIQAHYTRQLEAFPTFRVHWEGVQGDRWLVGPPELMSREGGTLPPALAGAMGTATSLAMLAVIILAVLRSRPVAHSGGWAPSERAFLAMLVIWAAAEPVAHWLPFNGDAILLSGGNDWLAYESFARDIQLNGPLMNNGRPPGSGEAYYYQPLYGYYLALIHALLGESLGPVLWWQHASQGLVAVLIYGLTRQLWGAGAGVIAALLVMAFRSLELNAVSGLLLSENLLFLVLPGMLWLFVVAYRRPTVGTVLAAGAALGLAGLTRSTPLLVLPFILLGIFLAGRRVGGLPRGAALSALFLMACFTVVGLATIRNTIVAGKPTLITTSAGANLIEAHRPTPKVDLKGIEQHPLYNQLGLDKPTREVLEFIRQDPEGYLGTLWPTAAYALGYADPILPGRGIEWPLLIASTSYGALTLLVPATRAPGAWLVHAFIVTHWAQTALFFSHQYGFRLPLPMYLPMLAVIGGAMHGLATSLVKRVAIPGPRAMPLRAQYGAIGAVGIAAVSIIALRSPRVIDVAPERLYIMEGDVGHIARAVREWPELDRPNWVYGAGLDTRTREIAYLRGLAFPLIKWIDSDRGMVFTGLNRSGLLGAAADRPMPRFSPCLKESRQVGPTAIYQMAPPISGTCLPLAPAPEASFAALARVLGSEAPSTVRAGDRFSATVAWETLERPDGRYRPQLELIGAEQRVVARAENNPYGADLWSPGEVIASLHELAVDSRTPPGKYSLTLSFVGSNPRPVLDSAEALRFRAHLADVLVEPPSLPLTLSSAGLQAVQPVATGDVLLTAAALSRGSARPGDPLDLTLAWQASGEAAGDAPFSLTLVGPRQFTLKQGLVPESGWPRDRWRRGETILDTRTVIVPNDAPPGAYRVTLTSGVASAGAIDLGELTIEAQTRRLEPPSVRVASDVAFGSALRLAGYDLRNRRLDAGDTVELGLTWQALAPPDQRLVISIVLLNEAGRVVYRRESEPQEDARPTTGWSAGEYLVDNYRIRTARDLPRGRYRLRIEVVERNTGRFLLHPGGDSGYVLPPEVSVE